MSVGHKSTHDIGTTYLLVESRQNQGAMSLDLPVAVQVPELSIMALRCPCGVLASCNGTHMTIMQAYIRKNWTSFADRS